MHGPDKLYAFNIEFCRGAYMYLDRFKIYLKLLGASTCLLSATGVFSEAPAPLTRQPLQVQTAVMPLPTSPLKVNFEVQPPHCTH